MHGKDMLLQLVGLDEDCTHRYDSQGPASALSLPQAGITQAWAGLTKDYFWEHQSLSGDFEAYTLSFAT